MCGAFLAGSPWQAVAPGELAGRCLGVDVTTFDPAGNEIVNEPGELVIRQPMPSMPVKFWNDEGDKRYRSSYFDTYPGVWRHGDWAIFSPGGGCAIAGRSDATLNRGGVRLGTSEFYTVVESLPEIADSIVVHLEDAAGGPGELVVFVVPSPGVTLDRALEDKIRGELKGQLSPRHIPDRILAVPSVPRTLTGKKLEAPVKQILRGRPADELVNPDALKDPDSLTAFTDLAVTFGR
ncbi:AMP-binding enzyme [Streptomyces iranensis]|uniref:Acetoacetyl-CoA synthetase n=1 Tax=Streptomyces iranensis TaxID=576784 RepID=A0A060ZF46_9ACTN|nr:acyl-coenzyme A synthetase/AMP-(fatty) acid ligase [Streptomyces iranensis]CDR04356.1 acetoacetyl-CoA synthetase [Streptomyces iranensis]